MSRVRAFGRFLFDFIVGDDWRLALGVVLSLGVAAGVAAAGAPAFWVVPAGALAVLGLSLRRSARSGDTR